MANIKMYGPAFDSSGLLVERDVPDVDVGAFESAGYVKGALPDNLKPSPAQLAAAKKKAEEVAAAEKAGEKATADAEAKANVEKPKVKP